VTAPRTTDDYVRLLDSGLASPATRPARVIVVGAGMAGLVAAAELARAGHDPVVLEAQQRVGGRILTLREPFAPGLWAEAGAMRIPRSHRLTMTLIERFGLEVSPFTMDNQQAYCCFGGNRLRIANLPTDPEAMGFDVLDHERSRTTADLWTAALEPFATRIAADGDAPGLRSQPSTTISPSGSSSSCRDGRRARSSSSGCASTRRR
jgi:monoamine oxidase